MIVGDCDPQQVALLELHPDRQKTRIDFACTEALLGIRTVCLTEVVQRGERVFYVDERGRAVPIQRFYNRLIFDDLSGETLHTAYRLCQSAAVSWVSHPHWFFRISKHSLPLLRDPCVPEAHFLADLDAYPPALTDNYVLKPLFSYSGSGVDLDPTPEKLAAIPAERRAEYLLQRKVAYAPLVRTPDGYAKAEVRLLLLWNAQRARLETVATLVRLSKGRMMGTRFNANQTWVGSTFGVSSARLSVLNSVQEDSKGSQRAHDGRDLQYNTGQAVDSALRRAARAARCGGAPAGGSHLGAFSAQSAAVALRRLGDARSAPKVGGGDGRAAARRPERRRLPARADRARRQPLVQPHQRRAVGGGALPEHGGYGSLP